LDSTLAAKILIDHGIDLVALNFVTPFCTCNRKGCQSEARKVASELNIPIQIFADTKEYIQMIKNPKHGYGKNMNPCIDCRIFIFSRAKAYMEKIGAHFIVTGEVLGERPMSQRKQAMYLIEKESDLSGLILRPLSAKLMNPTIPEEKGWVSREKLLNIQGRSRKPQISLAKEWSIHDYRCPAGGCRLTDPQFAKRFKDLLDHDEDGITDIHLLKFGRHFRLPSGAKIIIGRNETDNISIKTQAPNKTVLMECAERVEGPTALVRGDPNDHDILIAGALTIRYSDHPGVVGKVRVWKKGLEESFFYTVKEIDKLNFSKYRI
jgi:tRNA U34 2-thiouridine synthase MnmA/TrmU